MKRPLVGLLTAALAATVLVGCQPPPPSGWVAPVVMAAVSPDPVVAGEPFTVEVTAIAPDPVTSVDIRIRPPKPISASNPAYPGLACTADDVVPAPTVTRSYDCVMPEGAPNGAWRLTATATNPGAGGYQGAQSSNFTVVGGMDDQEAPVMESFVVSPSPVVIGVPFSVTVRAIDEHHLPPSPTRLTAGHMVPAPPGGQVKWTCAETTPTLVEPTVLEWRFTDCLLPEGTPPFSYGAGFNISDSLGYTGRMSIWFPAVAG